MSEKGKYSSPLQNRKRRIDILSEKSINGPKMISKKRSGDKNKTKEFTKQRKENGLKRLSTNSEHYEQCSLSNKTDGNNETIHKAILLNKLPCDFSQIPSSKCNLSKGFAEERCDKQLELGEKSICVGTQTEFKISTRLRDRSVTLSVESMFDSKKSKPMINSFNSFYTREQQTTKSGLSSTDSSSLSDFDYSVPSSFVNGLPDPLATSPEAISQEQSKEAYVSPFSLQNDSRTPRTDDVKPYELPTMKNNPSSHGICHWVPFSKYQNISENEINKFISADCETHQIDKGCSDRISRFNFTRTSLHALHIPQRSPDPSNAPYSRLNCSNKKKHFYCNPQCFKGFYIEQSPASYANSCGCFSPVLFSVFESTKSLILKAATMLNACNFFF